MTRSSARRVSKLGRGRKKPHVPARHAPKTGSSGRKKTPLDRAIQKSKILLGSMPVSWVFMYQPQIDLIKGVHALLLEESERQKALSASMSSETGPR
jgi:hypothetical protein